MPLRIVKLGGSLLELPQLVPRLRHWLAKQTPAATVLVVGGGVMADALRTAHRVHGLAEITAHWLCVRGMAVQAEMIAALLPEACRVASVAEIHAGSNGAGLLLLDPWKFLREDEPRRAERSLPETWDVTSDSIAARLAELAGADELVLLKSAAAPRTTFAEMVESGYVDRYFPEAAQALACVRFVNLRDVPTTESNPG